MVYHHITVQLYDTAVLRYDLSTAHTAVPTGTRSLPLLESTLVSCYLQGPAIYLQGPARFSRSGSRCGAFLVPWWCLLALGLGVAFLVPCSFKEIQISREEILSRFLDFCISASEIVCLLSIYFLVTKHICEYCHLRRDGMKRFILALPS